MSNIEPQRLDGIYRDYRAEIITSEIAIKSMIDIIEAFEYIEREKDYRRKYITELVKKTVRYIIRIDAGSKEGYKFLENCILNNTLDLNARYEIYSVLERNFPTKVKGLQRYIITYLPSFFPNNLRFEGDNIIDFGLLEFLFCTYKILSKYSYFSFNPNYKGLTSPNCIIVNNKRDIYSSESYTTKFIYVEREGWKIEGYNPSYYLINDKHKIVIKELQFGVNLFEKYISNFEDDKLSIEYSKDIENPIRLDYKSSDIRIYFFKEPVIKTHRELIKEKEKNRADAIELGWF